MLFIETDAIYSYNQQGDVLHINNCKLFCLDVAMVGRSVENLTSLLAGCINSGSVKVTGL